MKDIIKRFALRSSYYSVTLENYIFPKFLIKDDNTGSRIDLMSCRSYELKKTNPYLERFIIDIESQVDDLLQYIPSFPIVIDDRKLWIEILDSLGVQEDSKYRSKLFFFVDLFFKKIGKIVDISQKEGDVLDHAKSLYIKCRLGIEVIRFVRYGESEVTREVDLKYFNDILEKEVRESLRRISYNGLDVSIDYGDLIYENFVRVNYNPINFVYRIKKYFGDYEFLVSDVIVLTWKDLYILDQKGNFQVISKVTDGDRKSKAFINLLGTTLRDILGKTLIVYNSSWYSVKEVQWAMLESQNPRRWENFLQDSTIPRWVIDIFGELPPGFRGNIVEYHGGDNVLGLVKILSDRKPSNSYIRRTITQGGLC